MHGDDLVALLVFCVFFLLVIAPILAVSAWSRVRRLEQQRQEPRQPAMDPALISRVYALEQKVAALERRIAELLARPQEGTAAAAPREAAAEPPPQPIAPPPPPRPEQARPISSDTLASPPSPPAAPPARPPLSAPEPALPRDPAHFLDMETLIAGRWLNRIGIVLVVLAVAYFLKYAFDNQWIGPTGQVALGVLFGAALLGFSHWLLQREYTYFSDGIAGMGAAVLYLSLWAACSYYKPEVFSKDVAFFAMIAVTGAMLAIAVGRDSQRIAALALVGGFLTPWLVSTGQDAQVALFSYVAVLNVPLIALARAKQWRFLEGPAFLFTQIYFWGWYDSFYHVSQPLVRTIAFAFLFFTQFVAMPVVRTRQSGKLYGEQLVLVLANAGMFTITLHTLLWPGYRWTLTLAVLALAAFHLCVSQLVPSAEGERPLAKLLFAGLALTFVTLAIPIRLEGRWITMGWAVEGAVLMWTGFRTRLQHLRAGAFALFMIVIFRLLTDPSRAEELFLNPRFGAFGVTVACFGAALYFWHREPDAINEQERPMFGALSIAINALSLWALSLELHDTFVPGHFHGDYESREAGLKYQLSLSLLWTLYATGLIALGVRWQAAGLRWQALALFGIAVVKVFFVDLGFLSGFYRILSFIVLGVVLLVVSFLYQRRLAAEKTVERK